MAVLSKEEFFNQWKTSNPMAATQNLSPVDSARVQRATYKTFLDGITITPGGPGWRDIVQPYPQDKKSREKNWEKFESDYAMYKLGAESDERISELEKKYQDELSKDRQYSALAQQIAGLAGTTPSGAQQLQAGASATASANAAEANALAAQSASLSGSATAGASTQGAQQYNAAISGLGSARLFGSEYQPAPIDVGFVSQAETKEINDLVAAAQSGTSFPKRLAPTAEQPPKGALEFIMGGGVGNPTRIPNPDYDPKIANDWRNYVRNKTYSEAEKYIGSDAVKGLKSKYDQIYSLSSAQLDQNISNRLNFQVSDKQILDQYNASKISKLQQLNRDAFTQMGGIMSRLQATNELLSQIPESDPRYKSSKVYVDQLQSDLASVQSAINESYSKIQSFKPITQDSPEAAKEITAFREYLMLPEERATQQLRQIDPESYQTAVDLGRKYREMVSAETPTTTSPQTEALRRRIEDEAVAQLQLGAQLGAEEQRQYQQAARAAQTARGNIFGVGPAVEEAVTTGAAGEQRKLARYGAAAQFLASGETTGAALQRDIAFRDALLQNRLGAAAGFIAGGPSLYNLGQARTGAQQAAFQNYIQANQALPGGFQGQANQVPFYQTASPEIPVALSGQAASIYNTLADYQANTYGAQVGAISRQPSGAEVFGQIATGLSNLIRI